MAGLGWVPEIAGRAWLFLAGAQLLLAGLYYGFVFPYGDGARLPMLARHLAWAGAGALAAFVALAVFVLVPMGRAFKP